MVHPIATYLISHAVTALTIAVSILMIVRLFGSPRTTQSTFAWLLGFIFIPLLAIPLYLLVGSRKFPRLAKKASDAGYGAVVSDPRAGNSFELLTTGEMAFARLMTLIGDAQTSIDLTMFILGNDPTGRAVIEALAARASQGVRVRVILDAVGSMVSHRHAAKVLGAAGAQVGVFMPLRHSPIRGRTNLRSHRKLAVVDGAHLFAGGMNLAHDYMGPPLPPNAPPRWRDLAAIVRGPVADDAARLFESDWRYCGGTEPTGSRPLASSIADHGNALVQMMPSGPDMTTDTVYDLFLTQIFNAKKRVALVTPYYVPDDLLQHAMVLAARRGVKTEIILPLRSNHRIADIARRNLIREVSAAGACIYYYSRGMVHAKAMVVDDEFAYMGSLNFDMRSLFLNYENAVCVYSPGAIGQIGAFIDGLMVECTTAGPSQGEHRIVESFARLLTPEL